MSDTFQANYKTASNIVKNINSILATIKENNSLSEMQKQLSRVKQYFAQAQEALKIMRNTASVMSYNNKIQAMGSVRDIEQSLATIKKEIARQEAKLNKSSLVGADAEEKKKKMAEGLIQLQDTTGVLNKVKASAYESEAIGHGALEALGNQHEVLLRSSEKVEEVKTNANMAKQLLTDMNRKTIGNKVCVSVIIIILIVAIVTMLFLIANKNKK
ncbi:hypothetical protein AV274_1722 [Blastocystis sp. ATCC 50177/Nand II]|uniref:Uncharacterized protein n=1 Tax=Blastocystis sp. subtype 1 (strain ATCC 50177 / NandII) TaxID=478820 RepID=A0A196SK31_BLAHN|nr:hypothetical protein AV274_1722 [Blastocystis sp. ATCC 50177/Nand II]